MFKATGIILLFLSCSITGFYLSSRMHLRKKLLTDFLYLLQRLETEIGYFKEPLPAIFEKLQQNTNQPEDLLLRHCIVLLKQNSACIAPSWQQAVHWAYQEEPLYPADLSLLIKCGTFIGQSDYDCQKGHFALLKEELSRQIDDADHTAKTKGALFSKAGMSVGAVLAIALL